MTPTPRPQGDAGPWGGASSQQCGRARSTRHRARGRGRLIVGLMKRFRWKIFCREGLGAGKEQDAPRGQGPLHGGEAAAHGDYSLTPCWWPGPRSSDAEALHTLCQQKGSTPDLVEQSPFKGTQLLQLTISALLRKPAHLALF